MNKKELQKFKERLLKRISELLKDIGEYRAGIKEIEEGRSADWVDKVSDEAPLKVLESLSGIQRKELAQIEKALERIEDGSYGRCMSCGEEISHKRLRALPFAVHCVECQKSQES